MIFTSLVFLIFLTAVFGGYWLLKSHRQQNLLLLFAGYVFYGWWDYRFCALMLASSLADYSFGRLLGLSEKVLTRRLILVGSCLFNLGLLGFFKYFNFFSDSLVLAFGALGWHVDVPTIRIILPVGISFYTFQSMAYIIDVYRRQVEPTHNLLGYATYVAFFPQLLAGPIERPRNLLPQILGQRRFDYDLAVDGLRLILWGFFKKLVVADNLGMFADQAYAQPAKFSGARLAFATLCFAFQIYGDFSAYSDIARGTAQLFGITIMRNFAYPYFSQSVAEFWRRWHISLSSWFRDYLFVPMGGSRVSRSRQVFNIMTTFILSGLWHGASWTYVAWGGLNGVGILPAVGGTKKRLTPMEVPGGEGLIPNAGTVFRMARTFLFICVAWVFFRASSFRDAFLVLGRVVTAPFVGHASNSFTTIHSAKVALLLIGLFVGVEWICRDQVHPLRLVRLPRFFRWFVYTMMIWLALYLRPMQMANFIYFQF